MPAVAIVAAVIAMTGCHQKVQQAAAKPSPPSQFDLQCDGSTQRVGPNVATVKEPYSTHFRVDLDAGLWCRDKCESIAQLKRIEPSDIVFVDTMKRDDDGYPRDGVDVAVNRVTGKLTDFIKLGDDWTTMDGTCVRQPFSGLPERKF